MTIDLAAIRDAATLIEGMVTRTPCVPAPELSQASGARVFLKLENLQLAGSFKARGALVKIEALAAGGARTGLIAMSAGNHALGVAVHAHRLGLAATIVMPRATPFIKVRRTEALGARVVLTGDTLEEAEAAARQLAAAEGLAFVHPYDDERVIAGQGTVALEMLDQVPGLDCLIVPIGGGGLIAGMATAAKALDPAITVVGVQCAHYPAMARAVGRLAGDAAPPDGGPTLAEGIAVKAPGRLTTPIVAALVDHIALVGEAALEQAVLLLVESAKVVAEGAGAAAVAALLAEPERYAGRTIGLVVSGGNMDSRLLASVLLRGLARAGRMARLRVELSDMPGALAKVAGLIGDGGGNIIEVAHQRLFYDVPVKHAELDVMVEALDGEHVRRLVAALTAAGFPTRLLGSTACGED